MFTVPLCQWHFSLRSYHSSALLICVCASLIWVYGGRGLCRLCCTEALHQQLAFQSFPEEESQVFWGCVKCIKQPNDGGSPWNRGGSCCYTPREEWRDLHQSFIHTEGSRKARRWDWLSHTASASAQTSAQPWWDSQSRHAGGDRWGWPEDICSTRAGIGWQGRGRMQWKCQEFVQQQQPPRVPHLQRAVRLARRSPHHLAQLWPRTVPPLHSWDHEAGQGPGPAEVPLLSTDHAAPGVGDQEDAGGVIQRGSLWSRAGPRYSPRPWTAGRPTSGEAAGGAYTHLWMLQRPSLLCQRMETDAATLPLPLHHCSPAASPGVAGLLPVHGCSSHYAVHTFLIMKLIEDLLSDCLTFNRTLQWGTDAFILSFYTITHQCQMLYIIPVCY